MSLVRSSKFSGLVTARVPDVEEFRLVREWCMYQGTRCKTFVICHYHAIILHT